jgi:sugar/nucleoside kinase (ribokinase family)
MDLAASLDLGAVVGACATTVYGDTEGLPTWEELQQIRAGHDVYR